MFFIFDKNEQYYFLLSVNKKRCEKKFLFFFLFKQNKFQRKFECLEPMDHLKQFS